MKKIRELNSEEKKEISGGISEEIKELMEKPRVTMLKKYGGPPLFYNKDLRQMIEKGLGQIIEKDKCLKNPKPEKELIPNEPINKETSDK